jgi:putative RNA 2'-phosphotransferase
MISFSQSHKQLSKFLEYILGRSPHEFGLVPDQDGFVKLKEFFLAANEEEGWRHIRQSTISELINSTPDPPVEIVENKIRAINRDLLPRIQHAVEIPKLLYTAITQKSHPVILERGIFPTQHEYVILCSEKSMAFRIGKRRDRFPVLITVNVLQAEEQDIFFKQAGDKIYLTEQIPVGCFIAPPLPKEKTETKKTRNKPEPEGLKMPGSYFIDLQNKKEKPWKTVKEKADSWKRNKKRLRKQNWKEWPE